MDTDAQLAQYFAGMWPHLDEHARRLVAASQAVELGYGGIARVSRACGLSRVTLSKGVDELQAAPLAPGRIRHEGGGRHGLTSNDPGLAPALDGSLPASRRRLWRLRSRLRQQSEPKGLGRMLGSWRLMMFSNCEGSSAPRTSR